MKYTPFCCCTGNCYYFIHLCALLQAVAGPPGPKGEKVCHCCHYYDRAFLQYMSGVSCCLSRYKKANQMAITIKLLSIDE